VLIYPVIEEIFYRGLLLQLLRRYTPTWLAVLVPTSLFALTHIGSGISNVILAFAFGLVSSWLVIRSRSLLPSIVCHAAVNLSVLFILTPVFAVQGLTSPNAILHPFSLLLLVSSLAVVIGGGRILRAEFPSSITVPSDALVNARA
jgi:membrane protease YdiL (CAAX protease family)